MIYKKNIESTDKFIHELTKEEVTISGLPFTEKEGQFIFEESFPSFLLYPKDGVEVFNALFKHLSWYDSLEVCTKSRSYVIHQAQLSFPKNLSLEDANYRCRVQFYQLMDSQWSEKTEYYYRYLLPTKDNNLLDFIELPIYHDHSPDLEITPSWPVIRIGFPEERQIHLFPIQIGNSQFLVIETRFPCTDSAMGEYMYPISLSLGLVTSVAPFDYALVTASKTPEFDGEITGGMIKLRPTIKSQYRFFFSRPHNLSLYSNLKGKIDRTHLQQYDEKGKVTCRLYPMQEQEFSSLARMLYENKALARATLILLSAPIDFDLMGATYSVVLETICSALVEDETGTYMELKDWESVLPELKKTLSDFCEEHSITDEHKEVMIKKLDSFNSQTNGDKLTAPFERIGYKLSDPEKKVIRDRNRFLHGKVHECLSNESYKDDRQLYVSMELRKLCGILLFRHAGYKGPILNNVIALELKEALKNKEPLFITYKEKTEAPQPTDTSDTTA